MSTRKRRLWLQVFGEPVCHLFALWRRERDLAQYCVTEPVGLKSSAAQISGPLRDGLAQKRRSVWWKDDSWTE